MAQGFCPSLLMHLREIAGCATPQDKITPGGFLRMLLENRPNVTALNLGRNGHLRDVVLKYLKRAVPQQVSRVDNCDVDNFNVYQEVTLAAPNFVKKSFFVSTEDMARYCEEASTRVGLAGFRGGIMRELWDQLRSEANALIGAMDLDLLALQATRFGVNVHTGSNAAETVNFPPNQATNNFYEDGITHILRDAQRNEFCGDLLIVGAGNFASYELQRRAACCNQNGINTSLLDGYRFYNDEYSEAVWGENQIGVFSAGSVGLVEFNRYDGFYSGPLGTSEFFSAPLPIACPECNGGYETMLFDIQVRFVDCPFTYTVCGEERTARSGWQIIVSKNFGLFNIPTDAYQHTAYDDCYNDRLAGNNGTLRFLIDNVAA